MEKLGLISMMLGAACLGTALQAGDFNFSSGISATSNYVSNGISQTNSKPTIQAYFEAEKNGVYAGTWMSGVDFDDDDNIEVDLYLGYRKSYDSGFFFDLGYAHYFYDASGACCGEIKLTGAYSATGKLGFEGYLAYNPESGNVVKSAALAYAITDRLALSALYGNTDANDNDFWHIGALMAFNDFFSGEIRYYGAQSGNEGLVVTLSLATNQSNFARLVLNPFQR